MNALLVAAALSAASPTPAALTTTAKPPSATILKPWGMKVILVDEKGHDLLHIDGQGVLHLHRWCTPWDIAEAWLEQEATQP